MKFLLNIISVIRLNLKKKKSFGMFLSMFLKILSPLKPHDLIWFILIKKSYIVIKLKFHNLNQYQLYWIVIFCNFLLLFLHFLFLSSYKNLSINEYVFQKKYVDVVVVFVFLYVRWCSHVCMKHFFFFFIRTSKKVNIDEHLKWIIYFIRISNLEWTFENNCFFFL